MQKNGNHDWKASKDKKQEVEAIKEPEKYKGILKDAIIAEAWKVAKRIRGDKLLELTIKISVEINIINKWTKRILAPELKKY